MNAHTKIDTARKLFGAQRRSKDIISAVPPYPGVFALLDKRMIFVDERYQRDLNPGKVKEIRKNFNWVAFGTISVARRDDDTYYAMDGQHRVVIAQGIDFITVVPCVVFDVSDVRDEAKSFLAINTGRKPLTSIDTFRAKEVSGDEVAAEVRALATAHGFEVGKGSAPNTIRCVGSVQRYLRDKGDHVRAVFPIVASLCRDGVFDRDLFEAMTYLHELTGGDIAKREWVGRLERVGHEGAKRAMARAAGFYGRGTNKVWAAGLAQALNAGRHTQNKLPEIAV